MNSVTSPQLAAMLIISDLFALMCCKGGISAYTALGLTVGIVIQAVIALPLVRETEKGRVLPKWAKLLLGAGVILWCSSLLRGLHRAADVTFVPYESGGAHGKLLMTVLTAAVCLYISYEGMKAAARSASVTAAVGVLLLLTDLISAVQTADIADIAASAPYGTFAGGVLLSFSSGGSFMAFAALLPYVQGRKSRAAVLYFSCRLLLCNAVIMTTVLTAGGIMDIADFPVIMSAQLSQPFSSQRTDALFLMLFAAFGVFALTVQVMTAAALAGDVFPRFRRWRCTAVLLLSAAAMGLFTGCSSTGQVSDKSYVRCVGIDGDRLTVAFFGDDEVITAQGEDIASALDNVSLSAGRPIVTGFTELIVLGDCDRRKVLGYMLKEWKVSPSCMVAYSADPEYTIKTETPSLLKGRLKEAIKQGKAQECDIVTVLSGIGG